MHASYDGQREASAPTRLATLATWYIWSVTKRTLVQVATFLFIVILAAVAWLVPEWAIPRRGLSTAEWLAAKNDLRAIIVQSIGGLAVAAGVVLSWRNLSLASLNTRYAIESGDEERRLVRQGQVADRLTSAVNQIGDESTSVRVGGIYSLELIAAQNKDMVESIAHVLAAYLRDHAQCDETCNAEPVEGTDPRRSTAPTGRVNNDVRAAAEVLICRSSMGGSASGLDLRGVCLKSLNLSGAQLRDSDLSGAHLSSVTLENGNLDGATLNDARLDGANLTAVTLSQARVENANLRNAVLENVQAEHLVMDRSDLEGARLAKAKLHSSFLYDCKMADSSLHSAEIRHTSFRGSDMRKVRLINADCRNSDFWRADLTEAYLDRADFGGTCLLDTNLRDAYWPGAKLQGADLRDEDARHVLGPDGTLPPDAEEFE